MVNQIPGKEQDLIERLRREHSPEGHSKVSSIIRNALEILTTELYDTSTHFLLELLQNADDNDYAPGLIPWLQFTYTSGFLRVDCNEVGFNANNVEAICSIRNSTKSGQYHDGRTGEKGIGFKSVFKVADVVWIRSREFAFKFDKARPFGIIAPVWECFPYPVLENHTSFLLQLNESCDEVDLVQSLLNLDQTCLLFTRRLRHITVRVTQDNQTQTNEMRRHDEADANGPITVIDVGDQVFTYITTRRQVENLPHELKRLGSKTSELVLAFPVMNDTSDRIWKIQNVHNVLPIGKYGLKFIVQGDFLLTANRRHIDASSAWNIYLRDTLVYAFISSVKRLNCGCMRFSWPSFIPSEQTNSFFETSRVAILENLSEMPVAESFSGTLVAPSTLRRVEGRYIDRGDKPLTLWKDTADLYLSPKYPSHASDALFSIGVDELTDEAFVEDLKQMISEDKAHFHAQTEQWHSDLARTLIPMTDDENLKSIILRLPIVPLMNGKWVKANSGPRIFPDDSDLGDLLVLHSMRIIQPAAAMDANRRHLWSSLDIPNISRQDICQYIIDAHAHPASTPEIVGWTRAHLVAHARFLHSSNWRPTKPLDLWVATKDGNHDRSSGTYLFEIPYDDEAVARVVRELRESNTFSVLHDDYRVITTLEDDLNSTTSSESCVDQRSDNESQHCEENSWSRTADLYLEDVDRYLVGRASEELEEFRKWRALKSYWNTALHKTNGFPERPSPRVHDEWHSYLGEVLQVASLPRLAVTSQDPGDSGAYRMSAEFRYLFSICDVSDVLHLLLSNWHQYSSYIEVSGTGNKDREQELQELRHALWSVPPHGGPARQDFTLTDQNLRLLHDLRNTMVRTSTGIVPLQACVLPDIDSRFEDDPNTRLPTLKLEQYSAEIKARLKHFLISVDADARYYFKCLDGLVLTRMPPSYETVTQIYKEIQNRYDVELRFIRRTFQEHTFVCLLSTTKIAGSKGLFSWVTISEAIAKDVDLISDYPTCQHLFRSLCDPDNLQIDTLVRSLGLVRPSQTTREIIDALKSVSQHLAGMEPKQAAATVKILRFKSIFPVSDNVNTLGAQKFDRLLCADDQSWFINDSSEFNSSFAGLVPLLTINPTSVAGLGDLLDALKLGSRKLSNAVIQRSSPKGRQRFLTEKTAFLRSRVGFVTILIPEEHVHHTDVLTQIENVSVFAATEVARTYRLVTVESELIVNGPPVEAAVLVEGSSLRIFFAEETLYALPTSLQWFEALGRHCKIDDPTSRQLLFAALTEPDFNRVCKLYASQGHNFNYTPTAHDVVKEGYFSFYGNLAPLAFPFKPRSYFANGMGPDRKNKFSGAIQAMSHSSHRGTRNPSRQIPLLGNFIYGPETSMEDFGDPNSPHGGKMFFREAVSADAFPVFSPYLVVRDGYHHLRYIGESMVSQMFQDNLGQLYSPADCWTSSLRSRAGLPIVQNNNGLTTEHKDSTTSPFTLRGKDLSQEVWKLLSAAFLEHPRRLGVNVDTTYHFEVGMMLDDCDGRFVWDYPEIEKSRYFQLPYWRGSSASDVMVLVRIHDAFASPRFEFLIDPWYYFSSHQMRVNENGAAIIKSDRLNNNKRLDAESWKVVQHLGLILHQPLCAFQYPTDRHHNGVGSAGASQTATDVSLEAMALAKKSRHQKHGLPKYCYLPLGEGDMRLFVLFPGEYDQPLRGAICHMPFHNAGPYRALSYVWGPDHQSERNLATPQGVLKIKASLGSALQRIRQKKKELVLWIDSICINQEDTKEKVQQILLLPQIFQAATCTLAVLATDDRSYQAVGILLQIAALDLYGTDFSSWPKSLIRPREKWVKNGMPDSNSAFWQDVSFLFNRPWFRRAWIVQESIAARTVQMVCGKWIFDWNDLHWAMEIVDRKLGMCAFADSWRPFMILSEHREWEATSQRWPLLRLIQTFRYVKTGRYQRDRFFALLGLASDGDSALFEPDYESPLEVVVRRFAQGFVEAGYAMELLYDAGLDKQEGGSRFPSWVPDWTQEASDRGALGSAEGRGVTFSASGQLSSQSFYDQDKDILEVSGIICDTIDCVSRFSNEPSQRSRYFQELDSMIEACKPLEHDRQQQLKETIPIAGALYPASGSSCLISITESYSAYRRVLRKDELKAKKMRGNCKKSKTQTSSARISSEQSPATIGMREKSKAYASLLDEYIVGWKFVTTKNGRCGIAPSSVLPGDVVGILSGGKVPFLLRKGFQPWGGLFLIGQCYIDGIMFGEAVEEFKGQRAIPWKMHLS